jgi:Protein of unknown function (DUF3179)
MKKFLFIVGLFILFAAEILRVYFIMPFPGSQHANTIDLAYFIDKNIWYIRIIALLFILPTLMPVFKMGKAWKKMSLALVLILYGVIFYFFNFKFLADKMFYQPQHKNLAAAAENKVALDKLVVGVALNGEAKAYPIEIIGYHHQVQDTVGGVPVMITYCTVCRTGRAYSPVINGKKENFRLVGMDHFNAMFEDATTKSWWQQATGEAITGPMKGSQLMQLPSQQLTLAAWLREYPDSKILQPDTIFKKDYDDLAGFDNGTIKSSLEKRDSASWKMKSWVIGVAIPGYAKAYDWNDLVNKKIIEDSLPNLPLLILLEKDTASFHVWSRNLNGQTLHFTKKDNDQLQDINTQSLWNNDGVCISGALTGQRLRSVQASQEFWHSWQNFHPETKRYLP